MYEPDESPDGFPLEFGNIIIGLPKQSDQPNTSTTAEEPPEENSTEGDSTDHDSSEGDPVVGDRTGSDTAEGDPTESDPAEGDSTESDPAEGDSTESDPVKGDRTGSDSAEADSTESDPVKGDLTESNSADGDPSRDSGETVASSNDDPAAPADEHSSADDQQPPSSAATDLITEEASTGAEPTPANETARGETARGETAQDETAQDETAQGETAQADGAQADGAHEEGPGSEAERASGEEQATAHAEEASDGSQAAHGDEDGSGVGQASGEQAADATPEDMSAEDAAAENASAEDASAEDASAEGAVVEGASADGLVGGGDGAEGSAGESGGRREGGAGESARGEAGESGDGGAGESGEGGEGGAGESGEGGAGESSEGGAEEAGEGDAGESGDGGELTAEELAERLAAEQAAMALITALMKLRGVLAGSQLPLEVVGADEARQQQKAMLDQLDDYLLPRLVQLEAPILAVVGGSTGAGKSTLVNTVIGKVVSEPGVLRPTTRSPVLIHHPADADWFVGDRVLPGMARTTSEEPGGMEDAGRLRLVEAESVPRGLAILDAPDIDSVVQANRDLATQLLAAADLWLFVTTAARYSDAVPWEFLQSASDRSTAVAVVLDRAPSETIDDITGHLAQMLLERGLGDSPLFSIQETVVDGNGMLPQPSVASIKDWLIDLAADAEARAAVVRRTLQGAVSAMVKKAPPFAAAVKAQAETAIELRSSVESAYDQSVKDIAKASQDGTLLRGEVLARWQEFVGTGELLKGLQSGSGRLRDRLKNSLGNKPAETRDVSDAIRSGLESLLSEHAAAAAERAEKAWQSSAPGRQLLAAADAEAAGADKSGPGATGNGLKSNGAASTAAAGSSAKTSAVGNGATASGIKSNGAKANSTAGNGAKGNGGADNGGAGNGAKGNDVAPVLGAMSEEFPAAASRVVREWQAFVLDLIRTEGAEKKSTAKILEYGVNGLGLSLMVVLFASAAGIPKGAEASAGAGSAVVGQRLLEAVFGDKAVQGMVAKAREDLDGKVHALMDAEFARYLAVLDQHPVDAETARQLTEAARAVEDCT